MQWSQVIADPTLQNLPYKVELNEWGKVVLSPASNKHGLLQAEIARYLSEHKQAGKVITECSVDTPKGVKVADVAWGSRAFFERNDFDTPYQAAPELCVEIISPSNINKEINEKIHLYLAQGAHEVWICNEHGMIRFYTVQGEIAGSRLFPDAPGKIEF